MSKLWVTPEEMGEAGRSVYAYEASKTASFLLWALSGRKYSGTTTVTEKYECPCRRLQSRVGMLDAGLFDVQPYLVDGGVYNGVCGCIGVINGVHTKLRLRGRPVRHVSRVVKDGVEIDPGMYQLVNASVLQPAPGASLDLCGAEVTYTFGTEPPTAGRRAARHLATELAKSFSGEDCELPERVTSVSRQGVNVTVLDDQAFIDDLRTGIYAVDLFLKVVNPDRARKPARVFSPDRPRVTRVRQTQSVNLGPLDLGIVPGEDFEWRLSLAGQYGELLTDPDWEPQGQISTWSGAIVYDAAPANFNIVGDELIFTLSAAETSRISLGGSGSWDLYAISVADNSTVIHVMNSNVYLVGQSSAVTV